MKRIYYIIAGILLCGGCEKDIDIFQWPDGVHFEVKQQGVLCDTSEYTFAFEEAEVTEMIAPVRIQLTGQIAGYDRKINVQVMAEDKNPAGDSPYLFHTDTCYIRKGRNFLDLLITLKRDSDVQKKKYALRLKLVENEWFKTTNREWITDEVNGKSVDLIHHTILVSDILTRPLAWYDDYLGKWSVRKFLLICEQTGFKRKDFQDQSYMGSGRLNYIREFMNRYFSAYKEAHKNDPEALKKIQEDDGTFMQMGS